MLKFWWYQTSQLQNLIQLVHFMNEILNYSYSRRYNKDDNILGLVVADKFVDEAKILLQMSIVYGKGGLLWLRVADS